VERRATCPASCSTLPHNLCSIFLCPSLYDNLALSLLLDFLPLLPSIGHAFFLRLSRFFSCLFLASFYLRSKRGKERERERKREREFCAFFYYLYTHIPVSVRGLSFTFSFYRALYFHRYRCLGRSSKFRAGVHAKRPLRFVI